MKILITVNTIYDIHVGGANLGGMEVYACNLAEGFAKFGWDVDIIGTINSTSSVGKVRVIKTPDVSIKSRWDKGEKQIGINWKNYLDTLKSLDLDSYDLISINSTSTAVAKYINSEVASKKVVYYMQVLPRWAVCKKDVVEFNKMENMFQKTISDLQVKRWNEIGGKFEYLPYGFIDSSNFDSSENKDIINTSKVAICARLIKEKGAHLLPKLKSLNPDLEIDVIGLGEGSYFSKLRTDLAKSGITYREDISGNNSKWINYLMTERPMVISLANIEALGITPIEAFMCGLPCITLHSVDSAVSETILRGDVTYRYHFDNYDRFTLTTLGGVAYTMEGLSKMIDYVMHYNKFNSSVIRQHYLDYYTMNEHINRLIDLISIPT